MRTVDKFNKELKKLQNKGLSMKGNISHDLSLTDRIFKLAILDEELLFHDFHSHDQT